jgi:hypothetical protein
MNLVEMKEGLIDDPKASLVILESINVFLMAFIYFIAN